jgi:hypothetical protein
MEFCEEVIQASKLEIEGIDCRSFFDAVLEARVHQLLLMKEKKSEKSTIDKKYNILLTNEKGVKGYCCSLAMTIVLVGTRRRDLYFDAAVVLKNLQEVSIAISNPSLHPSIDPEVIKDLIRFALYTQDSLDSVFEDDPAGVVSKFGQELVKSLWHDIQEEKNQGSNDITIVCVNDMLVSFVAWFMQWGNNVLLSQSHHLLPEISSSYSTSSLGDVDTQPMPMPIPILMAMATSMMVDLKSNTWIKSTFHFVDDLLNYIYDAFEFSTESVM